MYSRLWVDKYIPKCKKDIIGNKNNIKIMEDWLLEFNKEKTENIKKFKNGLLLQGKPGIGKTSSALLLLKNAGYNVIEYNASVERSQKVFLNKLQSICSGNILTMIHKNKKTAIIMDEVDGCSNGVIGILKKYLYNSESIFKPCKNKIVNKYPLILICNNLSKSLKKLKKECIYLKFDVPRNEEIYNLIIKISKNEKINMTNNISRLLVDVCQNDLRRCIILLENIKMYFKEKKININDISTIKTTFTQKDLDINLFDSINLINNTKLSINNIVNIFSLDKVFIPLLLHENFNKNIKYNVKDSYKNKLENLQLYYNNLINSTIIDNHIYSNNNWNLSILSGILSCYIVNIILNTKKKKIVKYTEIKNSPVISKINYRFYNLKIINLICKKLNLQNDNFNIFTLEIYDVFIYNDDIDKKKKYILDMKNHKIDLSEFNKIFKLSYLYDPLIYTNKIKKKLETLYQSI